METQMIIIGTVLNSIICFIFASVHQSAKMFKNKLILDKEKTVNSQLLAILIGSAIIKASCCVLLVMPIGILLTFTSPIKTIGFLLVSCSIGGYLGYLCANLWTKKQVKRYEKIEKEKAILEKQ